MRSLVLPLVLALLPLPALAQGKALWAFVDSTMGFGDKMNFYHTLMTFAHSLNRTAVLPPFQITVRDYSPLAHADLQADGGIGEAGRGGENNILRSLSLSASSPSISHHRPPMPLARPLPFPSPSPPLSIGKDAITQALRDYTGRKEGWVSSFDLPSTSHFISVEEWFNVSKITVLCGKCEEE